MKAKAQSPKGQPKEINIFTIIIPVAFFVLLVIYNIATIGIID